MLSKIARPRIVPECALTSLSTKFITPLWSQVVSSAQPHLHRIGRIARRAALPIDAQPGVADVVGLRPVEHEVDRLEADDRRQQRRTGLAAGDEVAGIDAPVGHAPADRRADLRPFQIEFRRVQRRLGRHLLRAGDVEIGLALIEFAHRRRRGLHQLLGALIVGDVQHHLRLGADHVGLRRIHRELERALVDGEQQIALFDGAAVAEMHLVDVARDAWAHLDACRGLEPAGELVPLGDTAGERGGHRHLRRPGLRPGGGGHGQADDRRRGQAAWARRASRRRPVRARMS